MNSEEIAAAIIDSLNILNAPYMVVGSLSSNYYGIPRSTKDIDIVAQLAAVPPREIVSRLGTRYRLQPQSSFETITSTVRYIIDALDGPFQIELFQLSDDAHDQERFRRRIRKKIFGRDAFLPTAEDVVITKLNWASSREKGKDVEDVRSVIAVQAGSLDWDYIHHWCDVHSTRQLLDSICASIPPELR